MLNATFVRLTAMGLLLGSLPACGFMPNSGASKIQVQRAASSRSMEGIIVQKVDEDLAGKLRQAKTHKTFTEVFGASKPHAYPIGPGDTITVSIWETPPSMLFGNVTVTLQEGVTSSSSNSGSETFPAQMVQDDGTINVPFAGRIRVAGRSVREIEQTIRNRLQGKANQPQVIVQVAQRPSFQVAVLGDVNKSTNLPLTPKGERVLDALASAGGATQAVTKMSLQLSRTGKIATMPLDLIIEDPKQNIPLQPGDVLTALYQPWTISILGATGRNQDLPFEARGISLAQALARTGGLNDNRADPGGVFVFRFEDANLVNPNLITLPAIPANGKVPVVYQVDFEDPGSFLVTQNFMMQDKDVIYVANMPSAEVEKFMRMVGMVLTPTLNLGRYQLQVSE